MELDKMTLQQVEERLAALDTEVRAMETAEAVDAATEEKRGLLVRQTELKNLETRKAAALALENGAPAVVIEARKDEHKMEYQTREDLIASPEYRSYWLKRLQGKELNDVEKRAGEIAAAGVAGAIPTQTLNEIMTKVVQTAPMLNEVTLLRVAGNVSFAVEGTNTAAAIHTENGLLTPAPDTLTTVSLGGFEIVKLIRISATVQTMTINAFEGWITDSLAEAVGKVVENYIINGTGSSQPKGIDYARTWTDTSTAVDWASTAPTYAEIVELIGLLGGGYARNAKFLMNHKTYWTQIQNIRDDGKYPVASMDGGVHRIMGYPVIFSDYVNDGDMFFGDFKKVVANLSQDIQVARSTESGFAYNAVDFRGACIFDSDIGIPEAIVKGAADLAAGA